MQISFNKKIYSQQAVKNSIKDYEHLADFTLSQNKRYFLVEIKNIQTKLKNFPDEFSNYVLSLINK
jgi:hypothetical protein